MCYLKFWIERIYNNIHFFCIKSKILREVRACLNFNKNYPSLFEQQTNLGKSLDSIYTVYITDLF